MNILITGNKGFIGSQVELKLNAQGCHDIQGVDSLEPQVHGGDGWRARAGQVGVDRVHDCIIHLAAKVGVGQSMYDPYGYVLCNTKDTAEFLWQLTAHKPKRLIVASSMSVYGEGATYHSPNPNDPDDYYPRPAPTSEWMPPDLRSFYALTKYDQEQLCLIWGKANNVPTVALRFFNVYGPGQALTNPYTGVMAIFGTRLLNGKPPIIYEDGQQSRDFIHVDDIARAVVHFATLPEVQSGIYNVGTGKPTTIEEVANLMAYFLASPGQQPIKPVITGQQRKGDIRHCYSDISKIRATGWEPQIQLLDGLKEYCEWLKQQPVPEDKFDVAAKELKESGMLS